jgi:hypothetical protein
MASISTELEATAASLGIKAGKGWRTRLDHEHERLPGPLAQSCDEMRKWWDWLPPDIQLLAHLLEQLHWLIARIDDGLWENCPNDFDDFDRDLAAMRATAQQLEEPSALSTAVTPHVGRFLPHERPALGVVAMSPERNPAALTARIVVQAFMAASRLRHPLGQHFNIGIDAFALWTRHNAHALPIKPCCLPHARSCCSARVLIAFPSRTYSRTSCCHGSRSVTPDCCRYSSYLTANRRRSLSRVTMTIASFRLAMASLWSWCFRAASRCSC